MATTPPADKRVEDALAPAAHDGVSENEAAEHALLAQAEEEASHGAAVDDATDRVIGRWGDVLDRLGSA